MAKTAKNILPAYLTDIYGWLYLNPKLYNLLDNAFLLNFLTLGYHSLLTEEVKKEISPHSHILQIGATLGGQIEKAYSGLGMLGSYTIVDILPDILENCREKHLEQKIGFVHADAAKTVKGNYDIIICYMLLHELPPLTRTRVIDNILKALKPGGKAVFIDYHQPSSYHPLKYIIRTVNRLYQPFAESLWKIPSKAWHRTRKYAAGRNKPISAAFTKKSSPQKWTAHLSEIRHITCRPVLCPYACGNIPAYATHHTRRTRHTIHGVHNTLYPGMLLSTQNTGRPPNENDRQVPSRRFKHQDLATLIFLNFCFSVWDFGIETVNTPLLYLAVVAS